MVGAWRHLSEWRDDFKQGFLSLPLPSSSNTSACCFSLVNPFFVHSANTPPGLVRARGGKWGEEKFSLSWAWEAWLDLSFFLSTCDVLHFGKQVFKLLSTPTSFSWKLLPSSCLGGRKWFYQMVFLIGKEGGRGMEWEKTVSSVAMPVVFLLVLWGMGLWGAELPLPGI